MVGVLEIFRALQWHCSVTNIELMKRVSESLITYQPQSLMSQLLTDRVLINNPAYKSCVCFACTRVMTRPVVSMPFMVTTKETWIGIIRRVGIRI